MRDKGMYCDMCNEYYWVTDMQKVRPYTICKECVDFIVEGHECEA